MSKIKFLKNRYFLKRKRLYFSQNKLNVYDIFFRNRIFQKNGLYNLKRFKFSIIQLGKNPFNYQKCKYLKTRPSKNINF